MIKTLLIIFFAHFNCYHCQYPPPSIQVSTSYGPLTGSFRQVEGNAQRYIVSFRGIPYAEPPIRQNRFRDPKPLMPWSAAKMADTEVLCPQINPRFKFSNKNYHESEDCLYLNIFYPYQNGGTPNLPVLVYFHGGDFNFGGKAYYEPDILLRDKDLVLVTVNYRLGVFGFLSTNDEHIPGNFGIKDQIAALNFVYNEIEKFKGDRSQITIFGHDAGAISVDIHRMLPERMTARFSGSISSGGTLLTPGALQLQPYENAIWFAGNISCSMRTDKLLRCLQEKTKEELISMQVQHKFKFRPVIDRYNYDSVLRDEPMKLYQSADIGKQRHLFGLTSKEGAFDFYSRYNEYGHLKDNKEKIKVLLEPYFEPYTNKEAIAALVHYKYFATKSGVQSQLMPEIDKTLVSMLGSYLYESPTDKSMKLLAKRGATAALYVFEYKGQHSTGTMLEPQVPVSRDAFDVTHMDDIFSIFKFDGLTTPNSAITAGIVNCLYSFMKSTTDGICQRNYFQGDASDSYYYAIDAGSNLVARTGFRPNEETNFWSELVYDIQRLTSTRLPYFDYDGYSSYRTATWSLFAFIIVTILLVTCFVAFIIYKKKKDKTSLQFLKKRDKELEERYNFL